MRGKQRKLLLILFIVLLVFALPTWPYSAGWGYFPSGGLAIVLVVLLLFILLDRRRPLVRDESRLVQLVMRL